MGIIIEANHILKHQIKFQVAEIAKHHLASYGSRRAIQGKYRLRAGRMLSSLLLGVLRGLCDDERECNTIFALNAAYDASSEFRKAITVVIKRKNRKASEGVINVLIEAWQNCIVIGTREARTRAVHLLSIAVCSGMYSRREIAEMFTVPMKTPVVGDKVSIYSKNVRGQKRLRRYARGRNKGSRPYAGVVLNVFDHTLSGEAMVRVRHRML